MDSTHHRGVVAIIGVYCRQTILIAVVYHIGALTESHTSDALGVS